MITVRVVFFAAAGVFFWTGLLYALAADILPSAAAFFASACCLFLSCVVALLAQRHRAVSR